MSTALSVVNQALFERAPVSYNEQQLQLIKDAYARGASDEEFHLFVEIAKHRRLDILKGHMCMIKFKDKQLGRDVFQPVVKIDGYRSLAEGSGQYEGQTSPQWCGKDGIWRDVWLEDVPPAAARVGVYRAGFREPLYAVARFNSYAQRWPDGNLKGQWGMMADLMIAKCAESLALRKAFPDQLGGTYTDDELAQNTIDMPPEPTTTQPTPARITQLKAAPAVAETGEEKALDEALLAHCVKEKGEKNAPAFFKARYANKSLDEKRALAKSFGLSAEAPAAQQVVEAEIVEAELVEPAAIPARGEIEQLVHDLQSLGGCKPDHINAKIAKLTGGVYALDEIEEADLPKVRMMLNGYAKMMYRAAAEMAKEFKQ